MNIDRKILEAFSNVVGVECTQPEMNAAIYFVSDDKWKCFSALLRKLGVKYANKTVDLVKSAQTHEATLEAGKTEAIESVLSIESHVQLLLNTKQETP